MRVRWHLALALATVLVAPLPAAAQTLGAERRLTPARTGELQRLARVAAGPDGYLVVWQAGLGTKSRIRAARVGPDGASLDPTGLDLAAGPGGRFEPAVAFGHGIYLVVLTSMEAGDHRVLALRVGRDGTLLDPSPIRLSAGETTARMPAVAATGTGFVVAWAESDATGRAFGLRALRIGADLAPIDATPITVSAPGDTPVGEDFGNGFLGNSVVQNPSIALRGDQVMIVWAGTVGREQRYQVQRAALDATTGAITLAPGLAIEGLRGRVFHATIAPFGTGYLMSWTDFRTRGRIGRDDANAALLDEAGQATYVALSSGGGRVVRTPAVAPSGLVAFVDTGKKQDTHTPSPLRVRQVLPDGSSPGPDLDVAPDAAWPALATGADGATLLVYTRVDDSVAAGALFARIVTLP